MSYIRPTSNPEGLYIIGTSLPGQKGLVVEIMGTEKFSRVDGKPADYPANAMYIPQKDFIKACMQFNEDWTDEPIKFGEFCISAVQTDDLTEDILTDEELVKRDKRWMEALRANDFATARAVPKHHSKICLSWRNKTSVLWETTWWYIVDVVMADLEWEERRRKLKKRRAKYRQEKRAKVGVSTTTWQTR